MIHSTWRDLRLSRLMLGTVQFGMDYGIANRTGQPDYQDVVSILSAAFEGGVNCLDTAAAYGTSEEVLGRALHELRVADDVVVVTKVRPLTPAESADPAAAARAIEQSIDESRRKLRLECLPIVLFHRETDAVHWESLERLRGKGWLRLAGVSCDNRPGRANEFAADPQVAALQLPANVVDQRHWRSGVFELAAEREIAVFVRSVYLQGLLLMPNEEVPLVLRDILPVRDWLSNLARDAGIDLAELAVRYMLSHKPVTSLVVGVETPRQVQQNLAIFERGGLPDDMFEAIHAGVGVLREELVTPSLWPARKDSR